MSRRRALGIAIAILALTAGYLVPAAYFPLAEPDEARYAEVAREMLVTGDYVTPRINLEPFLDKPPLTYWAGAASLALFGEHEFAARLPVLLAALGGLLLTFTLARRMAGTQVAMPAVLCLATAPLYVGMGQILTLDMPLTFWVTAAMVGFWRAHSDGHRWWVRAAAVALAAGTLTKGPVAIVLVAVPIGAFTLLRGTRTERRRLLDPLAMLLLGVLIIPWFGLVDALHPGFLVSFLGRHHVARFAAPWHHQEPFWFFLAVLPVATFPWGPLVLMDRSLWPRLRSPSAWSDTTWFLALWAGWPLLLFTLSQSKLIPYITPALPPLAILAGGALTRRWGSEPARLVDRTTDLLGAVGSVTLLVGMIMPWFSDHPRAPLVQPLVLAGGCVLLVPSWMAGRARPVRAALALGVGVAMLLGVAVTGRALAKDYRTLSLAVARIAKPGDRIGVYRRYVQSLPFYTKRSVFVVRDDSAWRPNTQDLARMWAQDDSRILLLVDRTALADLRAHLQPPPQVLASTRKKLLISNRASVDTARSLPESGLAGGHARASGDDARLDGDAAAPHRVQKVGVEIARREGLVVLEHGEQRARHDVIGQRRKVTAEDRAHGGGQIGVHPPRRPHAPRGSQPSSLGMRSAARCRAGASSAATSASRIADQRGWVTVTTAAPAPARAHRSPRIRAPSGASRSRRTDRCRTSETSRRVLPARRRATRRPYSGRRTPRSRCRACSASAQSRPRCGRGALVDPHGGRS